MNYTNEFVIQLNNAQYIEYLSYTLIIIYMCLGENKTMLP